MLAWVTSPKVWEPLLLVVASILFLGTVTWLLFAMVSGRAMRATFENLLVILCFASLGATAGILAASSDSSAVAPLLPAVLSLVGGIAAYLVTGQDERRAAANDRLIVAACVTALSLALFTGAMIGAEMRGRADAYHESADYKKFRVDVEREVEAYKRSLALKDSLVDSEKKVNDVYEELKRRNLTP